MTYEEQRREFESIIEGMLDLAARYDNFDMFCASDENNNLLHRYLKLMRECHGERYDRSRSFNRYREHEAVAFAHEHENIMKCFVLDRKELLAYDMLHEGYDEETNTRELLAYENGCEPYDITIKYRQV